MQNSNHIIEQLQLKPHPEGGYFKETYRSIDTVNTQNLSAKERYQSGERAFGTAIYYMLCGENISHFHKVASDETWHFYAGTAIKLHIISPSGHYTQVLVGSQIEQGQHFQFTVSAQHWFSAELTDKTQFGLVGCTVYPGFDFADFTLASADELTKICPEQKKLIERMCLPEKA